MINAFAAVSLMAAALMAPANPTPTPTSPPPDEHIVIDVLTVNGSGCAPGTAAINLSEDNESFTVTYSEYLAQVGVGAAKTAWRKNCQLSLRVRVPSGFTYAIAHADYRGFASLEKGATATQRANYYFQGMSQTTSVDHPFRGPWSDSWQATDTTDIAALVFAPCGEHRNFNINTELRVNAGTSDPRATTSWMAMDSTDGNINTVYNLAWKRC